MKFQIKILAVLAYLLLTLFAVACGDDSSASKPSDDTPDVEVRYDTVRVNDSTIVIDTIRKIVKDNRKDSLYVSNSVKVILVMNHDTLYIKDSIEYRYLQSIENFDTCFSKWEGSKVVVTYKNSVFECRDGVWKTISYKVNNLDLSGYAQKGAFKFHSPIYLREALNDTLAFAKDTVIDEVSGNNGEFVIPSLYLKNNVVSLEVKGEYKNEVTGTVSMKPLTLQAIVELPETRLYNENESHANINLLTHLEYDRVIKLVKKGYNVEAAKRQAQEEILNALLLNVQTVNDSNDKAEKLDIQNHGLLLAVSILFLADNDEETIIKNIKQFREDIADNGAWDKNINRSKMADWAFDFEFGKVNLNIAQWNLSKASDFAAYLTQLWHNQYGLGDCNALRAKEVLKNEDENSSNSERYFICRDNAGVFTWDRATVFEKDTYGWVDGEDAEMKGGNVTSNEYVFDKDLGKWRLVGALESKIGVCTKGLNKKTVKMENEAVFKCVEKQWYAIDGRTTDSTMYKVASVGDKVWFAEDLKTAGHQKSSYGYAYTSDEATDACPAGWKLPNIVDAEALIEFSKSEHEQDEKLALAALKDSETWTKGAKGTDEYGLGLQAKGGYHSTNGITDAGKVGAYWFYLPHNLPPRSVFKIDGDICTYTKVSDSKMYYPIRCVLEE